MPPKSGDAREWPADGTLNVDALIARGWTPTPFREFVLKIQSRCNLDCDYCYMYHLADSSWRNQPKHMARETVAAAAGRIREHALQRDFDRVRISLHGGEPLLGGRDYLERTISELRTGLGHVRADISVQTNGVLLDDDMARFLSDADIYVGVSLDGDRTANDLHRKYLNGRSSYQAAMAGIKTMLGSEEYRSHFSGVLCVIQLESDPMRVWESFLELGIEHVDFLLPHGTWAAPPPGKTPDDGRTPYADWLIPVFDAWFDAPARPAGVRLFEDILNLVMGGNASFEAIGLRPIGFVTVETDGSYEQVDSMKAAFEGAAKTGFNVFEHGLDELFGMPGIVARQIGADALCDTCRACPLVATCGGGLYPHRYRPGTGFRNPSVYCADLYALISHIERRASQQLGARGLTLAQVRQSGPSAGGEGLADGRGTSGNGAARTLGGA